MSRKTLITAAAGSAFVASMAAAPVASAAGNPFVLSGLSSGYQVADNHTAKPMEGKIGRDNKAPSPDEMKATDKKMPEGKCGEGKCGSAKSKGNASKVEPGPTSTGK